MKHALLISILSFEIALAGCASNTQTPQPQSAAAPAIQTPQPPPQPDTAQQNTEPTASPQVMALRNAISQNSDDEILKSAQTIIDIMPDTPEHAEALCALADLSLKQKKHDLAKLYVDKALSIFPNHYAVLMTMARVQRAQGHQTEAVQTLHKAAQAKPDAPQPHLMTASIALEFLDTERALTEAKLAYELAPKQCDAQILYADALFANKQYEDAVNTYETASSCDLSEDALKNMAKLYEIHVQNPQKACGYYKILTDRYPDNSYYKASRDYQCGL